MREFGLNSVMRLGSLTLESNLFLSPLAGYTNLPFRLVVREIGGVGLCTTDLVNARSLLEKNPKAFKLIETRPADSPLAVQLFGSVPEEMRDAALMLESRGIAAIDINMGCPVRKVCNIGGGSAMMTELDKTAALVRGMVSAVKIPVTAKMRLGWDDDNLTAPDLARALEDAGVAAIFIHGRTREQGFGGTVNLAGIRKVVEAVKTIPVIGNGDIITPQAAKKMLDETGCAGVSIGRGAFYDPWIFKRTLLYLNTCSSRREEAPIISSGEKNKPPHVGCYEKKDTGLPPEPSFAERVRVMCRHLDLMIEVFGEEHGLPDVPQSRAVVCQAVRPVPRIQQARRADFHARGIQRRSGKLHPLASAISRRGRRIAAALPSAADGRVLHARSRSCLNPARTYSRAERAGGGVVERQRLLHEREEPIFSSSNLRNCAISSGDAKQRLGTM